MNEKEESYAIRLSFATVVFLIGLATPSVVRFCLETTLGGIDPVTSIKKNLERARQA